MALTTNGMDRQALPTDEKVSSERVQLSLRMRFEPIFGLSPQRLTALLERFRFGYLGMTARLWDAIERRDDRVPSVRSKRLKSVSRYGFEVMTVDDSRKAKQHKAQLEYFWGNLTATDVMNENERGGFSLLVRQMMDAVGKKYSVHEIVYQPRGGFLTATFRWCPLWFFENLTGRLRYLPWDADIEGKEMKDGEWLVSVGDGIMEACSVCYMWKRLAMGDWVAYSEKFGMPGVLGESPAAPGSPEWEAMVAAVKDFSRDFAAVFSAGGKISLIQPSGGSSTIPMPALVDYMNREMTILWRGADLSTQSHHGGGGGQGASVQEDEQELVEQDDAEWAGETLKPVSRKVIKWFDGSPEPLAYVRLRTKQKKDMRLDLLIDETLVQLGAPMAVADTLERYDCQMPDAGEALLSRPLQSLAPVSQSGGNEKPGEGAVKAALLKAGKQQMSEALRETLRPVLKQMAGVANLVDEVEQRAAAKKLLRELPALLKAANVEPGTAKVLEETMSASLFNGIAAAAAQRKVA